MTRGISRRAVLRGAGVTLALPWLESIRVFGATPFPTRFAVLFMGNGISGNHWWSIGGGSGMTLGRTLQPLEPVKHKINVINGLFNQPGRGHGIHPAQTGNLLSGVPLQPGAAVKAGATVDQVIATRVGGGTPHASLVLACEAPLDGLHESRFSLAYSSHLAWRAPERPVPATVCPSSAFAALFETQPAVPGASILDPIVERLRHLTARVAAADTHRVDAYLTRVRDVERRLEHARGGDDGGTGNLRDRARLMCDIIALAFQTDSTRVASLLLARDLSSLTYPFLGAGGTHHDLSHDDLSDAYERICRFHVAQLAYLARTLDAMPEGDGSVLDNCALLWLSNMWSGWKHDNLKLPVVLVGSLGGTIRTGRSLDYLYAGDENRKLCSLYLSIMDRMNVRLEGFGDATRRLRDL